MNIQNYILIYSEENGTVTWRGDMEKYMELSKEISVNRQIKAAYLYTDDIEQYSKLFAKSLLLTLSQNKDNIEELYSIKSKLLELESKAESDIKEQDYKAVMDVIKGW